MLSHMLMRSQRGGPFDDPDDEALLEGAQQVATRQLRGTRTSHADDLVAREEPLEIRIAGASVAVIMRTPGRDEELALGFLLTERIVHSVCDVASLRHCSTVSDPEAEDNVIQITLQPGIAFDPEALRRNLYASSSCGMCGKASIEMALREAPPLDDATRFDADFFAPLPERLRAAQPIFARTGGLHGAALFAADGSLLAAREDVGRHNAVDKVVGWAARAGRIPLCGTALLVSGRISYEIAQKALAARVPVVAAVSAPTSLAVALAERANLALVGFLRDGGMNVYGFRERIASGSPTR
jgi:FdhD protein